MENLLGKRIDNYRIDALLGEGGMGSVYRAFDVNLARQVALKVMHRQLASRAQFQKRFMQEAQAIARLSHPSIVTIYSFDTAHGLFFIVMEFVKGLSLGGYIAQLAQERQVVQLNESLNLIAQSADALGYAHRQGVVHRDIKPDNILIKPLDEPEQAGEPPMRAILTDFGLAKLLEGGIETATGTFMGTLPYMSPEQALARPIDGRSDIYSLGVVLYQLATGRLPFDIRTPTDAVMKHLNETPPEPRRIQPGLPIAIEAVIERALAKAPGDRYQRGEELARALRQAMTTLTDQDVTTFGAAADFDVVSLMTRLESAAAAEMPSHMEPDETFQAGVDRLIVSEKGHSPRAYALDRELFTIGRTEGNDLVLEGHGVSRRHVRLERTAVGWQIVDLGSTNGTFLEDAQLLPEVPENWSSEKRLRIGPFFLTWQPRKRPPVEERAAGYVYQATEPLRVPTGGSQILSDSGQTKVVVNPTNLEVAPGQRSDLQVEILNHGVTVDHLVLSVQGPPPSWLTYSHEPLQLMPGAKGSLPVSIHPPLDSSAQAGQHPYRLAVTSETNARESATLVGTVTVTPFERYSIDMRPKKLENKGICRVLIRNEGNFDAMYRIDGHDAAEAIRFEAPQSHIQIGAGKTQTLDLNVIPNKRPLFGRSQTLPFGVNVAASSGARQSIAAQLEVKPMLPRWLPAAAGALLAFLCLAVIGAYYFIQREDANATATSEAMAQAVVAAGQTEEAATAVLARETSVAAEAAAVTATALALTAVAEGDDDEDGISNNQELTLGTDPNVADTDGDGLSDGAETNQYGTDPKNVDSDGDTVSDGDEVNTYHTAPLNIDTDNDGTPDGVEIGSGGDPLLPATVNPVPVTVPSTATATTTPTGTPTSTPPPPVGIWDGQWQSECEHLPCGQMAFSHLEGEETVTGTFADGDGTIVGILEENRLTGTWSFAGENGTVDFWITEDGFSWQGNWDKIASWCGYRAGQSKPSPCGVASWYGEWTTACGVSSCDVMTITQRGVDVEGVYASGGGTISGTVSGTVLTGEWRRGSTGSLKFFLGNKSQFSGNWDTDNEWCGHRDGTGLPDPCLNRGRLILITPPIVITLQPSLPLVPVVPIVPVAPTATP